jgi:hypothetical protein
VTSDVPALIMSGQFDPITPSTNGEQVAATLSTAYTYVFPGLGHAGLGLSVCKKGIMAQFLDDPTRTPDASCIDDMGIEFVTGTEAVSFDLVPVTIEMYGLRAIRPDGWQEIEPGTYAGPGFEAILTLFTEPDWAALVQTFELRETPEQVESNGRTWAVYATEFNGMIGRVAAADSDEGVLVVGVFAASEERVSALEESLLWPVLESVEIIQ